MRMGMKELSSGMKNENGINDCRTGMRTTDPGGSRCV